MTDCSIDADIMSVIGEALRFQPVLVPDEGWYFVDANGTQRGTVGSVATGRTLMGIGHISMLYQRHQVKRG